MLDESKLTICTGTREKGQQARAERLEHRGAAADAGRGLPGRSATPRLMFFLTQTKTVVSATNTMDVLLALLT